MSSRNSLSDDWEDVGDDNFSVVSLATTDPEADAAAPTATSTSELDAAHAEPQPAQAPNVHNPTTPTQTFKLPIRSAPQQIDDPSETQEEGPDDPFGDPPSYEHHDDDDDDDEHGDSVENAVNVNELSEALDETSLDDTADVDPTLLQKELQSLHDILDQTANILRSSVPGLQTTTRWKALGFVGVLFNHAKELMPIISGYAKAWSSASSPQDLPIDPSLHGWLSGVRVKVLGLQAEVRSISRGARDCPPPPAATERPDLDAILLDLENYEKKMTEFLPIIRVDFNEFLTQKMTIPIASPSLAANVSDKNNNRSKSGPVVTIDRSSPIDIPQPSCTSTGASSQAPSEKSPHQGPSNEVWLLRHELYRLKDLIQQTMERLSYKTGLSNSGCGLASDISGMYGKLFTKLSTTLTNHGSDWIESYLEGGLTYPEFLGLDVDCIRDFAGQLRVTMNGMPTSASEAWPEGWAAQLERLEILVMVLSATLTPDRD